MNTITTWDEVDGAIRRMGEIDMELEEIGNRMQLRTNEIKEKAKKDASGLRSEQKDLEKLITLFCNTKKSEFAEKRSRVLNFGTVGFRIVKSVSIPKDKSKVAALIDAIKAYGLAACIKHEEKPDKDAIEALGDDVIAKLGLKRSVKDSFRIQPNREVIKDLKESAA